MKILNIFFIVLLSILITNAEVDDSKCNISNFGECFYTLARSPAKEQCNKSGVCSNKYMKYYKDCIGAIYESSKNEDPVTELYRKALNSLGTSFSFICEEVDGVWCFDEFRNAQENNTLNEFNCGKCGIKILDNYNRLLESIKDSESNDYKFLKEQIDQIQDCNKETSKSSNGTSFNNPFKTLNIYIVSIVLLISFIF